MFELFPLSRIRKSDGVFKVILIPPFGVLKVVVMADRETGKGELDLSVSLSVSLCLSVAPILNTRLSESWCSFHMQTDDAKSSVFFVLHLVLS